MAPGRVEAVLGGPDGHGALQRAFPPGGVRGHGPGPFVRRADRRHLSRRRLTRYARAACAPEPTSRTTLNTSRILSRRLMMRLRRSSRGTSTVVHTVAVWSLWTTALSMVMFTF